MKCILCNEELEKLAKDKLSADRIYCKCSKCGEYLTIEDVSGNANFKISNAKEIQKEIENTSTDEFLIILSTGFKKIKKQRINLGI